MPLQCVSVSREQTMGSVPGGTFYLGDSLELMDDLRVEYAGRVKCVYLDPPFLTDRTFHMSVRVGEADWKKSNGSRRVPAYDDCQTPEEYYSMMRRVLEGVHSMLSDSGSLFVHVDYRAHARLRILADEIFGEDNFVNEIIWAYKSGGRSRTSFPKKHDVILFYRKSREQDFRLDAVLEQRSDPPDNHMRRHVDPDGRVYRSIRSNGRIYTYYDDDPVAPTDVWDDISHLQQKDYERTGYDTQKPLKLLHRIERCTTREGDIVMDLFAGSCTSLEAAKLDGRQFVGVDRCPLTVNIARRRLADSFVTYRLPSSPETGARCEAQAFYGVGLYYVTLLSFHLDAPEWGCDGLDAVDNWSAGYLENGVFRAAAHFERDRKHPALQTELRVPMYDGVPAVRVGTVSGTNYYFLLDQTDRL